MKENKQMQLQIIQRKIYEIREQKVMLDFDLANLYGVETKVLKQAVRRNIKRFPDDFMFQLTKTEWERGCVKSKEKRDALFLDQKPNFLKLGLCIFLKSF